MLVVAPVILVSITSTMSAVEISKSKGSSLEMVLRLILIGLMTAAIPINRRMFRILLPMTLPRSISVLPLTREEIETASSGAPVPNATMVRPINCLETLKFDATEEAPETSQSAPLIKNTNPATSNVTCNKMFVSMVCFKVVDYIIA